MAWYSAWYPRRHAVHERFGLGEMDCFLQGRSLGLSPSWDGSFPTLFNLNRNRKHNLGLVNGEERGGVGKVITRIL